MPYRAPELFDPSMVAEIDERSDSERLRVGQQQRMMVCHDCSLVAWMHRLRSGVRALAF